MGERIWSLEQKQIFGWFAGGRGNLVVRARAGTGKTTTILEAVEHAPETDIVLCAFNKRIADELKTRIKNPKAEAKTLHSIGNGLVMQRAGKLLLDNDRGMRLAEQACGKAPSEIVTLVKRLASVAKGVLPFAGTRPDYETADREALIDLAWTLNILPTPEQEEAGFTLDKIANTAMDAMDLAVDLQRDAAIDFDDMIFLPVRLNWMRPRYGLVVVDEAQDMNAAQLLLAAGVCGGRTAVVGDDRQAIYGFRGADSGSIDRLKKELGAIELPLNTTYRCAKAIVAVAQAIVPDFVAAESNPQGKIESLPLASLAATAEAGDFVLSRTNAPLVKVCLSLLRCGTRARVEGKDIGANLITIVRGLKARSISELIAAVTRWEDKQVTRIQAKGRKSAESQIEAVRDKADMIRELAQDLNGPAEVVARIEALFSDNGEPSVVCSSVHKAKGLEADRVFLLRDTFRSGNREEDNIRYVACTRAKSILVWVSEHGSGPGAPGTDDGDGYAVAARQIAGGDGAAPRTVEAVARILAAESPLSGPTPADVMVAERALDRMQSMLPPASTDIDSVAHTVIATAVAFGGAQEEECRLAHLAAGPLSGPTPTDADIGPDAAPAPGGKYVPVRLAALRALLEPLHFTGAASDRGNQYVFVKSSDDAVHWPAGVTVRVYTTIPVGEEVSREAGEDSIRVTAIWSGGGKEKPLLKREPYVCRTAGWRDGILDRVGKVEALLAALPSCDRCGKPMRDVKPKSGGKPFFGCVGYPSCRGTQEKV